MNNPFLFFTKKRLIYGLIGAAIVAGAGGFIIFNGKNTEQTLVVHSSDFLQQVSASGKVVAKQNLDLSFADTGLVQKVFVNVGDLVSSGQLLASQSTGELDAQYLQMKAGVDLEQAKLNQLLAGASTEDIKSSQDAVSYAKQNLDNSYASALAGLNGASASITNAYTVVSFIQNAYFTSTDLQSFKVQDSKKIINDNAIDAKKYLDIAKNSLNPGDIDTALSHIIGDVNSTFDNLTIIRQQCDQDVYYLRVSLADKSSLDTQKTTVATALNNVISAKSSIASYKTALLQAQDALGAKQSPARVSDIAVYQAQIAQAKASVQNILAQLNKKRIYSPIGGVVAAAAAKAGSVFSAKDVAISVISKNNFQIESYVPQINISLIKVGQSAAIILDAYGDIPFTAKVISIDPAETLQDGVSTYKVTLEFADNDDMRIKSGMTGNIVVMTLKKSGVIAIPEGVVEIKNGQKFVEIKKGDGIISKEVKTGDIASNGTIEITSGLKDGDTIILK